MTSSNGYDGQVEALANKIIGSVIGAFDIHAIYLGQQLGLYSTLADGPGATSRELASRTNCDERYVREWLEQQAVTGLLEASPVADAAARRYTLPPAHAEVLLDRDSLNYVGPIARLAVGALSQLQPLLDAYRSGAGISFSAYGADLREGQADINRPPFLHVLAQEWIPAMHGVHERLQRGGKVADLGCGVGWSAIGIARAYPQATVDGFDLDEASIAGARENLRGTGVEARVTFAVRDAGDPALSGQYDLVTILEALHDMANPVQALEASRRLLSDGGSVLVVDERVADEFTAPGDDIERLMYGWSVFHCLPSSRTETTSAATGTVMRHSTVSAYAEEAGFRDIAVLPIDNLFFRLYQLRA